MQILAISIILCTCPCDYLDYWGLGIVGKYSPCLFVAGRCEMLNVPLELCLLLLHDCVVCTDLGGCGWG